MSGKLMMVFEILLIVIYLALVVFVFAPMLKESSLALVYIGVLTIIIFPLVLFMDKKREKGKAPAVAPPRQEGQPAPQTQPIQQAPTEQAQPQPAAPPSQPAPAQPASPQQQPPTQQPAPQPVPPEQPPTQPTPETPQPAQQPPQQPPSQ